MPALRTAGVRPTPRSTTRSRRSAPGRACWFCSRKRLPDRARFAKIVFTGAGVWGIVVLTPLVFAFGLVGRTYPPAITHPDFYYGFIAIALAWQAAFLVIGRDPVRYRPLMVRALLE